MFVKFLVFFCKEDRLNLLQSTTDPGENLVLNLTIDPGRRITSTEGLKRQREKPQYIPRSGDDVCRSRFPQDRRAEAKDSHYLLYAIIEKLAQVQPSAWVRIKAKRDPPCPQPQRQHTVRWSRQSSPRPA
jgi:hypothetical protein